MLDKKLWTCFAHYSRELRKFEIIMVGITKMGYR